MDHNQITDDMLVYYVPAHAQGNLYHKDVEQGIVTSENDAYIFVRFGAATTSKACKAEQLSPQGNTR